MRAIPIAIAFLFLAQVSFAEDEGISIGKVHLNGEGGVAFFDTGPDGQYPNAEFQVDEAKLFVEAPLVNHIYVFSELNLITREATENEVKIGELYVEFEGFLKNHEGLLNVRVGRVDIPFGEEYLRRDAIDNPLISHSVTDFWGVDEGLQAFGSVNRFQYVIAVLNGGDPELRDFNSDKGVTGRVIYDFPQWVHLCFSAMRTGDLDVDEDRLSALWIANGFVRSLGSPSTTTFGADLYLGEGEISWKSGHFRAGAGQLFYHDNDPTADNARDVFYFQLEGVQNLIHEQKNQLYTAVRYGKIKSDKGFPFVEHGAFGRYFFGPATLTSDLWRLSLGIGFRLNTNVLFKVEYTFEYGEELNGYERDEENFFGAEVAFQF